jgi:hypothetical protein
MPEYLTDSYHHWLILLTDVDLWVDFIVERSPTLRGNVRMQLRTHDGRSGTTVG